MSGDDCRRFPSSEPTRDRWGNSERAINLNNPETRQIVIGVVAGAPPAD